MSDDADKVRWLFLDLNCYFASVEQQLNPKLRGKPVAVVPLEVDSSCCIAASREAKLRGVKTPRLASDVRRLCPDIHIVKSRPQAYVEYHHKIVTAVESCIPVTAVHSIDEMSCRLTGPLREVDAALALAKRIKGVLREDVGASLTCSIGLAPTRLLAKVATDMQKPDGLTVIRRTDLPDILYSLAPIDIPGIGPRMNRRLEARGITTMPQVWNLSKRDMKTIWGGIVGERFWYWLHGHDVPDIVTHRSTVGHQHVLAPEFRSEDGAYAVLQKLVHKAALRLRREGLWATGMAISVDAFDDHKWDAKTMFLECQDTLTLLQILRDLWKTRLPARNRPPFIVGATLVGLVPDEQHNFSFFDDVRRLSLSAAIDRVNARYGCFALYFAGIHTAKTAAPTRIPFQTIPELCED